MVRGGLVAVLLLNLVALLLGLATAQRLTAGLSPWPYLAAWAVLIGVTLLWLARAGPAAPHDPDATTRLRQALDAGGVAVWDWDVAADRAERSGTYPALLDRFPTTLAAEDRDAVRAALRAALMRGGGDTYRLECRAPDPHGGARWFEARGRVVRDADGRALRLLGTLIDITDRRHASDALRAARDAALAANEAKSAFLASMSHEIRTPLGGVMGMTELLLQTPLSDEGRDFLKTLSRSAEALFGLINDVLDISKIESGRLELERIAFDPRELVTDALRVVSLQAQRKGLALRAELADLPPALVGDPGRLRQVLLNLLSNAVKFTLQGEVVVAVRVGDPADLLLSGGSSARGSDQGIRLSAEVARDERALAVRFEVRDTGIGIPAEKQARVFEPFAQADSSTSRTHGGTGLGLAIVLRLVERMGGRLSMRSTVGEGTSFAFTLPLLQSTDPARRPLALTPTPPTVQRVGAREALHILVAEDNPVNQEVLTQLLRKAGCRAEVAHNGAEAVAAVERGAYDLVLMDVQMPEMDGLRAARLIRAREKATGGRVPILAVTANALAGERERCLAAGMDGYLTKPVRGPELLALIDELLGGQVTPLATDESREGGGPEWVLTLTGAGFGREEMQKLVRTFLDTVPARLAGLEQAVAASDAAEVKATAHLLKGSLAVFAARYALEAAAALESQGQAGDLTHAGEALGVLLAEARVLLASLESFLREPPSDTKEG